MRRLIALIAVLSICIQSMIVFSAYAGEEITTGMAIVNNPNPKDRLNLRVKPDKASDSLGKYYSGTQVEILESAKSEWVKVRIGFVDSGYMEGYMLNDFLVYPGTANDVQSAFPMMRYMKEDFFGLYTKPDSTSAKVLYASGVDVIFDLTMPITVLGDLPNGWCHVAIEVNDYNNPRANKRGNVVYTAFVKQDQLSPLSDHLGIVSKASIEYDSDPKHPFSETELNAAVAVIKEQFETNYVGCELVRLLYDEALSDELLSNEPKMEISPQYIVFSSDFNVLTSYAATGFEAGSVTGWTWFLYRDDSDSEWQVIGWGMF